MLLVQRPANASLMAGMWELPALSDVQQNGDEPLARLRHSITDTDYEVSVFTVSPEKFHSLGTDPNGLPDGSGSACR